MSAATYDQKKKKYMNVFYGLIALTVVELLIVLLPWHNVYMNILIAVFSSAKAVVVGYYYMHLEYETKWLKVVACLPIIAFGYAFFLVKDAPHRPMSIYVNEAARVFKSHGPEAEDPFGVEKAAEEAEAELMASSKITGDGAAASAPEIQAPTGGEAAAAEGSSGDDVSNWR